MIYDAIRKDYNEGFDDHYEGEKTIDQAKLKFALRERKDPNTMIVHLYDGLEDTILEYTITIDVEMTNELPFDTELMRPKIFTNISQFDKHFFPYCRNCGRSLID